MMKNLYEPISSPYIFFRSITRAEKSQPQTYYHRHNAYEIYLFLSGSRRVCVEIAAYVCSPGDMFIIRPETFHAGLCDEACEYDRIIMNIRPELIEKICQSGADISGCFDFSEASPIKRTHLDYSERKTVIELFERFDVSQKSGDFESSLLCDTYMLQFLIFVNRWFRKDDDLTKDDNIMPKLISDVMDYINEHIAQDISMDDLTKRFYFNARYISKLFSEYTGITIRTYIVDKRVALAKRLLGEGCNVSQACYMSGFNDYTNFLRSFKKYAGVSPGRFRRGK